VQQDDRVIVDVGHPDTRHDLTGDLMHVPARRDADPDIDDLPDGRLARQIPTARCKNARLARAESRASGAVDSNWRTACRSAA
jgi:hypothetical protein